MLAKGRIVIYSFPMFSCRKIFNLVLLFFMSLLSSCGYVDMEKAPLIIEPASFSSMPGWYDDDHINAVGAFLKSCEIIMNKDPSFSFGPDGIGGTYGDWKNVCLAARYIDQSSVDERQARLFFEKYFKPYKALADGKKDKGLFTGYYEASLYGSLEKSGKYKYPLLKRPDDLVMVDLGIFREGLKGQRIAGRVVGAHLKPYEDRSEIQEGKLSDIDNLALVWVDNPVDAFFLHIQGSGRINFANGEYVRLGYDGQNGHPYYAIGRELIHRGHIEKDNISMQTIRAWLEANKEEAPEIMNTNKSYIFFRHLDEDGPLGGSGATLTPGRSLAIDRTKIPYGVPVWLDIEPPVEGEEKVQRLVVAQDTGGAIRGPIRGDVFWGYGDRAEYLAGHMKSEGRYWLLLPKEVSHN
jgi:membrane-bound lytic murein transglycosylase A